jgi:hypothetical protein
MARNDPAILVAGYRTTAKGIHDRGLWAELGVDPPPLAKRASGTFSLTIFRLSYTRILLQRSPDPIGNTAIAMAA